MVPKSITFKRSPQNFGEAREMVIHVRWLANYHGCLFGRGNSPQTWNFKYDKMEGEDDG